MLLNSNLACIKDHLESNMTRYLNVLQQMVSINSFTARPDGVNMLGDLTAELFNPLEFMTERMPSVSPFYGDHLILTKPGLLGKSSPTIGMVSHLDTVYPLDEERRNNFSWRVEGDKAYGPGTVDIKGGTLMIFMILEALQACVPQVFQEMNWVVLMNAAEETLEPDFGELCRQRLPKDSMACLVFEGGRRRKNHFALVTARKGMVTFRVEVEGKSAHAGSAHYKGANAIVQLAHTISQISDLTDYQAGITYNVGTVAGGTVINRVPHMAVASGEMRAYQSELMEEGISHLKAIQDDIQVYSENGGYGCDVNLKIMNQWQPWPQNEATARLLSIWQEAASELGYEVFDEQRGGLSDGNHLWDHVPTIDGLGPSGGNAHCSERSKDGRKDQEFVSISSFVPKALLNSAAILRLEKAVGSYPGEN